MKKLYLVCGTPGSGKSTWIAKQMKELPNSVCVSRDEERFKILREKGGAYFAFEKDVFHIFIAKINVAIKNKEVERIFVDATHLTEKARKKVLNRLELEDVEIIPVNFMVPVRLCVRRNEKRKDLEDGLRYVPRKTVREMARTFVPATDNEKYIYSNIIYVDKFGKESEKLK